MQKKNNIKPIPIMKTLHFGILGKENTGPFIVTAILYSIILCLPFIYFLYLKGQPHYSNMENTDLDGKTIVVNDWRDDAESRQFRLLTKVSIFSAALSFGALGAAVSLITRARSSGVSDHKITIKELISIQTIGAVFAFILSLIFMGEMIGGTLFPNADEFYYIIYIPAALAKLLVWSFLAGFAERLVPNILNNLTRIKEANEE